MIKQYWKFAFMVSLVLALGSCEKADNLRPRIDWHTYTGKWKNVNASANDISRIILTRREIGRITMQVWGRCGTEVCQTGLFSFTEAELKEQTLPIQLQIDGEPVSLSLGATESRKLELKAIDENSGFDTQFFSWEPTASFFEQVTATDVRSLEMTDTPINAGPDHPDNLLVSGTIMVFQTSDRKLGKIQVISNSHYLSIRWQTFAADGTPSPLVDYFPLYKTGYYDLDEGKEDESTDHLYSDFYWSLEDRTIRWLQPVNASTFAAYHLERRN